MKGLILTTEEFWANSQLSIVRHTGHIKVSGHVYVIVNKEGKDIFECSIEAERAGREKAIEPGEPADLLRRDFIKGYKALGRAVFLEILEKNMSAGDKALKRIYKTEIAKKQNQP